MSVGWNPFYKNTHKTAVSFFLLRWCKEGVSMGMFADTFNLLYGE